MLFGTKSFFIGLDVVEENYIVIETDINHN